MTSKIILKKSSVAAKAPVAGDLVFGELAINYTDSKLYFKKADGSIDAFTTAAASAPVTSVGGNIGAITDAQLLASIKNVDGAGSGLDADFLDGLSSASFYLASNPNGYTNNTGTVTSVGATTPLVSSGGNTPSISIPAANSTTNGFMSSAYASKLDGIAAGATANTGTVTSVGGTGTVSGLTLSGTVTGSGNLTLGGTLSLTSGNVTSALGYTPYNSTNPSGYITSSALSSYLPLAGGTLSGRITRSTSGGINSASARFALTTSGQADFHISSSINGTSATNTQQYGITFSPSGGATQAGILFSENGSDGTGIGFFCTNSYAAGPQLRASIDPVGNLNTAGTITQNGTSVVTNNGGTWGINITGNAATATSVSSVSGLTLTSSANGINPDSVTQNQLGYNTSVSLFGQTDGGLYSSAHSSSWIHQIYGDFRTGQIATRGKNNGTWQAWRVQVDSGNVSSYAVPLRSQSNWNDSTVIDDVIGLMAWKNYGNSHVIFDASQSTTPSGRSCNNTNPEVGWVGSYPTLMGWNGSSTYGVRVDSARLAEGAPGTFTAAGNIVANSDESLKKDWQGLPDDFIERMASAKHGTYTRIDSGERQAGSSAQDWQKLLPEVVSKSNDGILSLAYGNAALVSAIELAKRVVELEERLAKLEKLLNN